MKKEKKIHARWSDSNIELIPSSAETQKKATEEMVGIITDNLKKFGKNESERKYKK